MYLFGTLVYVLTWIDCFMERREQNRKKRVLERAMRYWERNMRKALLNSSFTYAEEAKRQYERTADEYRRMTLEEKPVKLPVEVSV